MKTILKRTKLILLAISLELFLIGSSKIEEKQEGTSQEENEMNFANSVIKGNPKKNTKYNWAKQEEEKSITISAVGDCTLGTDIHFGYPRSFPYVLEENEQDYGYFFEEVKEILENDDLTIANLETTLTEAGEEYRVTKQFNFKGGKDYTNILERGSIEAVNLANNHMFDYGEKGYQDTKQNLDLANIPYFGYNDYAILESNGIKIGLAGLTGWDETTAKVNTEKAISYFKENQVNLIIMTYHWGIEREYKQNKTQENIAHYAIDHGADLVLGHHPHVLQGIENYQGKYIVYSLGNFVFGGNKNPNDKDTMIFQATFQYKNKLLKNTSITIIPCSLSSQSDLNNYQPCILEGEEYKRVLKKIMNSSTNLEYHE